MQNKKPPVGVVWIFFGTTHLKGTTKFRPCYVKETLTLGVKEVKSKIKAFFVKVQELLSIALPWRALLPLPL